MRLRDEAAHNLTHAPRQTIAGLGDAAFVETGPDMSSITVLKGARAVRIVLTGATKVADPQGRAHQVGRNGSSTPLTFCAGGQTLPARSAERLEVTATFCRQ
jgi:hypothetical protein